MSLTEAINEHRYPRPLHRSPVALRLFQALVHAATRRNWYVRHAPRDEANMLPANDLTLCIGMLLYVADDEALMRSIHDNLRPGLAARIASLFAGLLVPPIVMTLTAIDYATPVPEGNGLLGVAAKRTDQAAGGS